MNKTKLKQLIEYTDYELDNYNQIVIYTGWYEHDNGEIHDYPEEEYA
jgi:hypothetical protein